MLKVSEDGAQLYDPPCLSVKCCARIMGYHSVATSQGVLHCAPWVVGRCWLNVPYIPCITINLATLEGLCNGLSISNGASCSVYNPSSLLGKIFNIRCPYMGLVTTRTLLKCLSNSFPIKPFVPSCNGALTVTKSHCATNSLRSCTRRTPTAFSASAGKAL